ncbi:MAG TPA: GAF domain-containing SpoIIE family protein phosphatase [Acidimicrobiales bacterium]|nr:GAF domain-containing SpoIIE family protein phosphatase [Acidimicrobiales bacterium]
MRVKPDHVAHDQVGTSGGREAQTRQDRLQDVLALTEAGLARLEFRDLLIELLQRIREVLGTDTAALFVLEEGPQELAAWAAVGIDEESLRRARIPLGHGFTGRVASLRQTLTLDNVSPSTVASPVLWEMGVRALLGTPLLNEGKLIGVVHVGTIGERGFSPEDAELLELAAGRLAGAVRAHVLAGERDAADLLERSLRPSALPKFPDLELAARYIPAERAVGGDWYDVFSLPSGELWLVTGDVAGHGLAGAIIMGRTRSAMRAYAFLGGPPEEVLALTDRELAHFEPRAVVTALCATSEPPFEEFRVCSAGHLPPVIATPGHDADLVDVRPGPPLGAVPGTARSSVLVPFAAGAVMVLYTDGLVERRGQTIDAGLAELRSAVSAGHPEAVCNEVLRRLLGSRPPRDDIALVAVRKGGGEPGP